MEIESYLRKAEVVGEGGISRDLPMDRSNTGDSSTGCSTQPAMSGNTRELATSLVEMKIASGDLPMPEVGASQGEDYQQPPGDASDSLNVDPLFVYPLVWEDIHADPMNVDDLPMTVDTMITEEPSNPSHLRVTNVVHFILPLATTQPEETPQSTLEPIRMNVDVVDDSMRDLDQFSLAPKELVLCS